MKMRSIFVGLLIFSTAFIPLTSRATGFQHMEVNAAELGDLAAGSGAFMIHDPDALYYNPAGLIFFDNRAISYSTNFLSSNSEFNGQSSWNLSGISPVIFQQVGEASSHKWEILPAFNEAIPLTRRIALGLGIEFPFGYKTEYPTDGITRYVSTDASLLVVDFTPDLAFRVTPKWSVGAGLDVDYFNSSFDQVVGNPIQSIGLDSTSDQSAHGFGVGWHAGILYQLNNLTRLGLVYHSSVSDNSHGSSNLSGALIPNSGVTFTSDNFNVGNKVPGFLDLSVARQLNSVWTLGGSLDYTRWSSLGDINLNQVIGIYQSAPRITNSTITQHLHDSVRLSVGSSYAFYKSLAWRLGLALDQSPYSSGGASVLSPDNDSVSLGTGLHYQLNSLFSFDAGYAHQFPIGNADVNQARWVPGTQYAALVGDLKKSSNNIGLQINWDIGAMKAIT